MNISHLFFGTLLAALLVLSSCSSDKGTEPGPKTTVTDIDGNVYETVTIGAQVWLTSNLRVTHYRNGEAIPNITDSVDWQNLTTGAYSDYNNDPSTVNVYGRYYNWYTVIDGRNIAPVGWRVASDEDWQILIDYLGGPSVAGGKIKQTGTTYWNSPNTEATNETGMSILGTGERDQYSGFKGLKSFAVFWTSTEDNSASANYRECGYNAGAVYHDNSDKRDGYSVRCVKGDGPTAPLVTTDSVSAIGAGTATCGGNVTADGGSSVTARGVCWSTTTNPTIDDNRTVDGSGAGSFTSSITGLSVGMTYYVRAYATNSVGTGYGNILSFTTSAPATVTDIDGNVYEVVAIGPLVWMAENLKVIHYRNGDAIPTVLDGMTWDALTTGAYCKYANNDDSAAIYGLLYNWHAAADARNIAPEGWHVATQTEWSLLSSYLGENSGGKLKDTGTTYWLPPNAGATNEYGFTALPGGMRGYQGYYGFLGQEGHFWTATQGGTNSAYEYYLSSADSSLRYTGGTSKTGGFSIRCVRDY